MILCPKCKGSGEVFDSSSLVLTVMLPFAMWLDSTDDSGIKYTKKECPLCEGYGDLEYDD